jgi:hypothetical protein
MRALAAGKQKALAWSEPRLPCVNTENMAHSLASDSAMECVEGWYPDLSGRPL